jgi:TnpA family transposase
MNPSDDFIPPERMAEIYYGFAGFRAPGIIRQTLIQYECDRATQKYWRTVLARVMDHLEEQNYREKRTA